jgi:hypothetical protein
MANWASVAEVLAYTGTTVTDAQITMSQAVIDIFSGTQIEALANHSARDLRLLKMATAYQTVWQIAQVDVTSRTDVKQLSQDGANFTPAGPDSLLLAPLAARCLAQLSWKRSRSVQVKRGLPRYPTIEAYESAWLRDETPDNYWAAL